MSEEENRALEVAPAGEITVDKRLLWRELFLISLASLFCELLVIRWLATEIKIFAYFKNMPLMAAFLGLGLGFIWAGHKRDYFRWSGLALLYLSGLIIMALPLGFTFLSFVDPFQYMLFGIGYFVQWDKMLKISVTLRTLLIMMSTFALTSLVFIGFGQKMGQLFQKLKPLEAYSINVAGALLGTILFSALCWLGTSPGIWLFIAGTLLLLISRKPAHFALIALALAYSLWIAPKVASAVYGHDYVKTVWSPFYRIDVENVRPQNNRQVVWGFNLCVNYDLFHQVPDCTPENLAHFSKAMQKQMRGSFEMPFSLTSQTPAKVLILGTGAGNDIAGALRCGVKHIDAVEIDPGILSIGRSLNPQKPYASPKVKVYLMDARTFLQSTKEKYDLILFAFVDSHTAFSSMSSLRTDNYLFTVESFRRAAHCLSPNGLLVVRFLSLKDWLWDKQAKSLAEATGIKPLGYCFNTDKLGSALLLSGPGIVGKDASMFKVGMPIRTINLEIKVPISRDDWPFLFLEKQELPYIYMLPIFLVLLTAFMIVFRYFKDGAHQPINWQMFFLGMGFMLLEVRAMADLSLLFGSTWLVNSAVISGVLVTILMANLLTLKLRLSTKQVPLIGTGLLLSLGTTTLIQASQLATLGPLLAQIIGVVIYLFPLVFASVLFAILFKDSQSANIALAFNLIGGLIGVCLEYLSMWLGVHALGWLAIVIYLSALVIQLPVYQRLISRAT